VISLGTLWSILTGILKFVPAIIRKYTFIPEVFVRVEMNGPYRPNRPDIQSIVFSLTSRTGISKVEEGCILFYNPDNPTQQEKQHTGKIQLFEGKEKEFRLQFTPLTFADRVMIGESRLKAECNRLGIYVCPEDSELIDDYRDHLKKIRYNYPELSRRRQQLTAFEGVLMNRLDEARALLDKPLLESVAWDSGL
jgi:hypothetical protein